METQEEALAQLHEYQEHQDDDGWAWADYSDDYDCVWSSFESEIAPKREPQQLDFALLLQCRGPSKLKTGDKKKKKKKKGTKMRASRQQGRSVKEILERVSFHPKPLQRSKSLSGVRQPTVPLQRSNSFSDARQLTVPSIPELDDSEDSSLKPSVCTDIFASPTGPCIQQFLPATMRPSVIGPMPRAALTVATEKGQAIAVILCSPLSVKVVPLVGCENSPFGSWGVAAILQREVSRRTAVLKTTSIYHNYLRLCEIVASAANQLSGVLEEAIMSTEQRSQHTYELIYGAFHRFGVIVGRPVEPFHVFAIQGPRRSIEGNFRNRDGPSNFCLICFDEIPKISTTSLIWPCGHKVCVDCWTAYLRSNAASGLTASIRCPSADCSASVDLLDAAHILFGEENADNQDLFGKLVSNEVYQHCLQTRNGRFCPSPNCGRLLVRDDKCTAAISGSGWNMLLCSCGVSLCADCPKGCRSHPGMSCASYAKLREKIDSGKADTEYANYQWLLNNSRPCPTCSFPIEKDGGCNHVRCTQCQVYFCWYCGGPGNECMAYRCKKANRYWHETPGYESSCYDDLRSLVERLRSFRQAETRLLTLEKASRQIDATSGCQRLRVCLRVESEMQQVILWLHSLLVDKDANIDKFCRPLQRLELTVHALQIRKLMEGRRRKFSGPTEKVFSVGEVIDVLGGELAPSTRRRQRQTSEKRNHNSAGQRGDCFDDLMADYDLKELCTLDEAGFLRSVKRAIREGISSLLQANRPEPIRSSRKKSLQKPAVAPLNVRKGCSRNPWKDDLEIEGDSSEKEGEKRTVKQTSVRRGRWKGKARVKSRRLHALVLSDFNSS